MRKTWRNFCLNKYEGRGRKSKASRWWWWWKVNFKTWCISNIETHENHIGCIIDDEFQEKSSKHNKMKSSWAKKSDGIYFFKLHTCIHTFFFIQQSHDVVLPSRMMKGAPWEKSHFFFLLTIFFCVWRYNNNNKRSSKKNCSWVVRFGWGSNGSVW